MIGRSRKLRRKSKAYRAFGGLPANIFSFPTRRFVPRHLSFKRPNPKIYGKLGDLEVRLANSRVDVRRAQKLRFRVFYKEMSAISDAATIMQRRDIDQYDPICDHLLVVDKSYQTKNLANLKKRPWPMRAKVVGTYRLLRQEVAELYSGFYTQGEYDIASLVERKSPDYSFVELGRSCVLKPFRTRRTVELLWQGIWNYIHEHKCDVMIGCASFPGTDPKKHAEALSFLYHNALAPEDWRVRAHDNLHVDMNMMAKSDIDMKSALKAMPPLIKGYLRLGAYFGDGAVIDHQFGTTDVLIVMPLEAMDARYHAHYSGKGGAVSI